MFQCYFWLRGLIILVLLAHFATLLPAQTRRKMRPKTKRRTVAKVAPPAKYPLMISGCILNAKALHLEKPEYPALAKAARAAGTVSVQIQTDETGQVIRARAASGNPLLYAAAVKAALKSRFAPTLLYGKPIRTNGVINYNFVAQ